MTALDVINATGMSFNARAAYVCTSMYIKTRAATYGTHTHIYI